MKVLLNNGKRKEFLAIEKVLVLYSCQHVSITIHEQNPESQFPCYYWIYYYCYYYCYYYHY